MVESNLAENKLIDNVSTEDTLIKDIAIKEQATGEKVMFIAKKMPSLMLGLALYAVGILLALNSELGMSPWDVFHMGLVRHSSFTLGQVSIGAGLVVLLASCFIGVIPGLASVLNMIFIGVFIDAFEALHIITTPKGMPGRLLMLISGILVIGWASYFYLRVNLGAGPRDSLMEGLVKKLNKPVWLIRGSIEGTVLLLGYLLGGPVGIGTLVLAATLGFSVQAAFKIGRYSSKDVKHMDLFELCQFFKSVKPVKSGVATGPGPSAGCTEPTFSDSPLSDVSDAGDI